MQVRGKKILLFFFGDDNTWSQRHYSVATPGGRAIALSCELGLSHFEVRKYDAILLHFAVTQVSHLFLARQTERLRGEKPGDHPLPSPHRRKCSDRRAAVTSSISEPTPGADLAEVAQGPTPGRRSSPLSHGKASYDFQSTAN